MIYFFRQLTLLLVYIYRLFSGSLSFLAQSVGVPYQCKFPQTCSEFAIDQLKNQKSYPRALFLIVRRLLSCGPWAKSV